MMMTMIKVGDNNSDALMMMKMMMIMMMKMTKIMLMVMTVFLPGHDIVALINPRSPKAQRRKKCILQKVCKHMYTHIHFLIK